MKILSFDTEDDSKGKVFIINFYDGENHFTFHHTKYKNQFELKKAAIEFLYKFNPKKLYAHNAEYDIINLAYPYFMDYFLLYYSGRLIFSKVKNSNIKIADSFNFTFTNLKSLGEEVGVKKIEVAGQFDNIDYCRVDTKIVFDFMKKFQGVVKDEFDLKIKNTIAGTSFDIYTKKFMTESVTDKNTNEDLLNWYYGGRTEVFRVGDFKNIFAVDVNSMYPFVMRNFEYPTGEAIETIEPLKQSKFYFSEVEIEVEKTYIPIIPFRSDKLLFPTGKFTTYATSVEIEASKMAGILKKCRYIRTFNFIESGYIFRDFIDHFYNKRLIYKKENNKFMDTFYKRVMNSTYGRFALKGDLTIISSEDNNFISEVLDVTKKGINYAIPALITAQARVCLHRHMMNILSLGGKIIYTDTDSVFFTGNKNIIKKLPISKNLGDLSLEEYEKGTFYNVKSYMLESEGFEYYKQKGIPSDKRKEYQEKGKTVYQRPMKLKSAMKGVKGILPNEWHDIEMVKRVEYDKRIVLKNGDTEAKEIK